MGIFQIVFGILLFALTFYAIWFFLSKVESIAKSLTQISESLQQKNKQGDEQESEK